MDVVKRLDKGGFSGEEGTGVDGWNTFLAFFSMEFVRWRRVNGMSALLTSVACAVNRQAH